MMRKFRRGYSQKELREMRQREAAVAAADRAVRMTNAIKQGSANALRQVAYAREALIASGLLRR